MKVERYIGFIVLLIALVLSGCIENEPVQKIGMPITICLPANEVYMPNKAPRRVMGDPGKTEQYLFPHHLYFIVMKQNKDDDSWSLWHAEHRTLEDEDWKPSNYIGLLPTTGDSIYQYTEQINLMLSSASDQFKGHVYAIASAVELSFNRTLDANLITGINNLNDLLTLTFDASSDAVQANLEHIYTSPYNLELYGEYFGKFDSRYQKVPYVNMLLYRVAAKVDINWYVDKEVRINKADPSAAVRLTYMDAQNLFNGNAYCFKPLENVVAEPLASGATKHIIGDGDEGMWWEGRSYFYTIPYTTEESGKQNYFPLQMLMETNESGNEYKPTIYMQIDKTSPFAPWLRANFNLSAPLSAGTPTKIVNY